MSGILYNHDNNVENTTPHPPGMLSNTGSTARDFLAFERNFLTQLRFGLLLSFLSSSFLLRARIPTPDSANRHLTPKSVRLPLGCIYFGFGFGGICLALFYYIMSNDKLTAKRALLRMTTVQTMTLAVAAGLVLVTCVLLVLEG